MRSKFLAVAAVVGFAALGAETGSMEPKDLAAQLQGKGSNPMLIHVGFSVLYRGKHIPQSVYAGPASRPDGLNALKAAVTKVPHDREIVVYCGCCPYDMCPNIKPALAALKQMGFTHVKALVIPTNFATDWVDRGYPVELGEAATK